MNEDNMKELTPKRKLCSMSRVSDIKRVLVRAGHQPPYLSELRRHEVTAWIVKYLSEDEARRALSFS